MVTVRVQFSLASVNNTKRTINALFTQVKSNDIKVLCNLPDRSVRKKSQPIRLPYYYYYFF